MISSSIGVIYAAFGKKASNTATKSYESLRKFHPDIPVICTGTNPIYGIKFIPWHDLLPWEKKESREKRFYAGRVKPFLYNYSPFELTLYLDVDTEICGDIMSGFEHLEHYDICVANEPRGTGNWDAHRIRQMAKLSKKECDFTYNYLKKVRITQVSTSMIFFKKCEETQTFFRKWYIEWQRFGQWDEKMAFMRTERNCLCTLVWHLSRAKFIYRQGYGGSNAQ